jgi:hypothetical protein
MGTASYVSLADLDNSECSLIGALLVKLLPPSRDRSHGSFAFVRGQRWAAA